MHLFTTLTKIPINNDPHKALLCDECVTVKLHYGHINFATMKTCNPLDFLFENTEMNITLLGMYALNVLCISKCFEKNRTIPFCILRVVI